MGNEIALKKARAISKPLRQLSRNKYRFQEWNQQDPWDGEDENPDMRQFIPWDGKSEAAWMEAPRDGKQ